MVCKIAKENRIETLTQLFGRIDKRYTEETENGVKYWLHITRSGFSKICINVRTIRVSANEPDQIFFEMMSIISLRFKIEEDEDFYEDISTRLDGHYRRMKVDVVYDKQYKMFKDEFNKQLQRLTAY